MVRLTKAEKLTIDVMMLRTLMRITMILMVIII